MNHIDLPQEEWSSMNNSSRRRMKRLEEGRGRGRGGRRETSVWRSRRKRKRIRRVGDSSNQMQVTPISNFSYSLHYDMSPCAVQQSLYNKSFKPLK